MHISMRQTPCPPPKKKMVGADISAHFISIENIMSMQHKNKNEVMTSSRMENKI